MEELAKYGINKPTLRFRFTETELRNQLDDDYAQALQDLGWLNCIGAEDTEKIHAFFHPTFQEYFAACSIDDWDYFLPETHLDKPVHCLGEDKPTYRVFEPQWRQVILLWMGRESVKASPKEKFIEKLTNFDDGVGNNFYYYRAYCMAAICVGEFTSSQQADTIVRQIVKWAFGYFDTEKQELITYVDPIASITEETILFAHREKMIAELIILLKNTQLDENLRFSAANALGKIAVGDKEAISELITFLKGHQAELIKFSLQISCHQPFCN